MATTVYIGLGSNLGNRERFLEEARRRIAEIEGIEVIATSSIYVTKPQDMQPGTPNFLNQVIKADYACRPLELLHALEAIEQTLGRQAKGDMQPRTIDLDILLFGHETVAHDRLVVPHRSLLNRPFALIPLLEIDPELIHPITGLRLAGRVRPKDYKKVELYRDHVAREV